MMNSYQIVRRLTTLRMRPLSCGRPEVSRSAGGCWQSGRIDRDVNSPVLPGAAPFAFGGL